MPPSFQPTTANRRQREDLGGNTLSAVNALTLATGKPWEEVFHLLEDQAVFYGRMLHEIICAYGLLAATGYAPAPKPSGCVTLPEISDYLVHSYPHVSSAILVASSQVSSSTLRMQLLLPETSRYGRKKFVVHDTSAGRFYYRACKLYLPAAETGLAVSPPECPPPVSVPATLPSNHVGYRFYQPNPRNNYIGDCVIRAYSAVLNVDWGTALRQLAHSCELNVTILNSNSVYQYLLSELHCTHHDALRVDGHLLKGVDFCAFMNARYHHGERMFVKVGPGHVAAVIPNPDEKIHPHYVIADSWDSSRRAFGDYWVYTPPPPEKKAVCPGPPLAALLAGSRIRHPAFGDGEILSLDDTADKCIIRFDDGQERSLSAAWVLQKCTAA